MTGTNGTSSNTSSTPRLTIANPPFQLRDMCLFARLGVLATLAVLLGGTAASGLYLYMHHEGRDETPGMTIDDIKGHYHGVIKSSPLLEALQNNHPEELPQSERTMLINWLTSDRIAQDYDDLDKGDNAPAEIIASSCLSCHARAAQGENAYPKVPLEYWDDVRTIAFSKNIQPITTEILAASTHTHALGLASLTLALMAFAWCSSWPRMIISVLIALTGLGLLVDIGSWWLTRWNDNFAYAVVVGGFTYSASTTLLSLLVALDLLLPKRKNA